MWWIYALLSALFASLTAIFSKLGVSHINSNLATAIRTVVILILILGIVLFRGEYKGWENIPKRSLIFLIISGITTGLSWLYYFKALALGPVSQVAVVDKLSVVLTIGIAVLFLGETLSLKMVLGVLLVMAGTYLVI